MKQKVVALINDFISPTWAQGKRDQKHVIACTFGRQISSFRNSYLRNNHDVCDVFFFFFFFFLLFTVIVISMLDHTDFSVTLYTEYSIGTKQVDCFRSNSFKTCYLLYVYIKVLNKICLNYDISLIEMA